MEINILYIQGIPVGVPQSLYISSNCCNSLDAVNIALLVNNSYGENEKNKLSEYYIFVELEKKKDYM
jgi:hypothetical protein